MTLATADRPAQDRLVERRPEPRRGRLGQEPLTAQPEINPPFQLFLADGGVSQTDYLAGVGR
jgi:hypothetical protein